MGGFLYRFDHQGPSGRPRRVFFRHEGLRGHGRGGCFFVHNSRYCVVYAVFSSA